MTDMLTSLFRPSPVPLVSGMVKISHSMDIDSSKCEIVQQLGIFFDGTDNNKDRDSPSYGDSNVVRLFRSYRENEESGIVKIYIPGVGTPFPEIGEAGKSTAGTAFAIGCKSRIFYALLWVLNSIYFRLTSDVLLTPQQLKELCTSDGAGASISAMASLGVRSSLAAVGDDRLQEFLRPQVERLRTSVKTSQVRIKHCYVDVFGFSRGAAEARAFCNWLNELTKNGAIGLPFTFRFLGIFDTVASVGMGEGILKAAVNSTGGHVDWADKGQLKINAFIKNCVHLVAMHEIRKNFPLDEVSLDGTVPSNCIEIAYPGAHSDIGGGYRPGQLGLAKAEDLVEGDSRKLAQVPLSHMFEYAKAAGVPLTKTAEARLDVHPDVEKAFKEFLELSGPQPRKLSDWMAPYLAWRWQVRERYLDLEHVKAATAADRKLLLGGNKTLIDDANHITLKGDEDKAAEFSRVARMFKKFDLKKLEYRQEELASLDPEAPHVLACAKAHPPIPPALAQFFDRYVHDSLAGFRKDLKEPTGYWRYRRSFRGTETPELTKGDAPSQVPRTA